MLDLRNLHVASAFVQDYEASIAQGTGHPNTHTLQAMQLRAAHKMVFLDVAAFAAEKISKFPKTPPKKTAKKKASGSTSASRA